MLDKYTLGLIAYIGITLSQIILNTESECTCSQISTDQDCNQFSPICQWNAFQGGGGNCTVSSCYNQKYSECIKLPFCSWTNENCQGFSGNCQDLNGTIESCNSQNNQCYGNTQYCSYLPTMSQRCSDYQSPSQCTVSQQGDCFWNSTACVNYQNCNQIPTYLCTSYRPFKLKSSGRGNYCSLVNNQCVQSQCSFLNKTSCTYAQTLFNTDQFMLCYWDAISKTCQNAYSTNFLTNNTCLTNTMGNYRWIYKNNQSYEGYCFQCQYKLTNYNKQCSCDQLVSQYDCLSAQICSWANGKCFTPTCSQIQGQQICYKTPNCAWDDIRGCFSYNRCQNLNGSNSFDCLQQSLYCPESNGYQCMSASVSNNYGCVTTGNNYNGSYSQCATRFSMFGNCYQGYENGVETCVFESNINCYRYNNDQQECQKMKKFCYWYIYNPYYNEGECTQANCQYFTTQETCTYFLYGNLEVQNCIWEQNQYGNGSCQYYYGNNQQEINYAGDSYQNCFTQSKGQYRWSSNSNKTGVCIQCAVDVLPQKKTQCTCDQLIYQGDCALAADSCIWNFQTSTCVNVTCNMLTSRSNCIQNFNCHWIQVKDEMKCLPFTKCSNLPGSNSYQCLLYSRRCTSSDGQYCRELTYSELDRKCSSIQNYTDCYLSVGSDGVCAWSGTSCYALSNCTSIVLPQLCGINSYACTWNYTSNACQSLTCNQITNQDQCTYYDSTINLHPQLQMCQWVNQTCQNLTSTSTLTSSDCYLNSGNTYRWSDNNGTTGDCESCLYIQQIGILILTIMMIQ